MPKRIPDVSVVIVNWNTAKLLQDCIESIIDQTQPDTYEIIVVDNGSTDGSAEMIKRCFPEVVLTENTVNVGFAKANNQGFARCRGRYILLLNSDTIILDRAIQKTIQYAESDSQIGVVGCKLLYRDGSFQNSCFRFPGIPGTIINAIGLSRILPSLNWDRYGKADRYWKKPVPVDCVMGSFLLIRRDLLERIGHLDEVFFMYAEETDLCCRVRRQGKKVMYYPGASIIHYSRGSQKSWEDHVWACHAITRGTLRFMTKWKPARAYVVNLILLVCLLPRILVWGIRDLAQCITTKSFSRKYIKKAGLLSWHCMGILKPNLWSSPWSRKA